MRMGWVGHVACMEAKRNTCRVLVGKLEERYHLEDQIEGQYENGF